MCLATPLQIKSIKNNIAIVEHDKKDFSVALQLIPQAKVGDWILAHGEIGISVLPENEAHVILGLIKKANQAA